MIFVTIGTSFYPFDRLIKEIDDIAKDIEEEIILQKAGSNYKIRNIKNYFDFKSKNDIENFYKNSRIVICHAGMGSIRTTLRLNKRVILVPRRKIYGELFDDHQIDFAKELEKDGIAVVYDIKDLKSLINSQIKSMDSVSIRNEKYDFMKKLRSYLDDCDDFRKGI